MKNYTKVMRFGTLGLKPVILSLNKKGSGGSQIYHSPFDN